MTDAEAKRLIRDILSSIAPETDPATVSGSVERCARIQRGIDARGRVGG